ncbi:MAG: cobalamin-dependent protein, partial [Clostridia bacterium]|nr:cobalamin-dependent protein [Clostridia bacterium]
GEKFKNNEVFVPEVLVSARAMNMGIEVLKPHLAAAGVESKGTAVIGTVKGDLHDIGKNLVKMMLEGKGLKVIDLGVDVAPETFVQAAIDNDARLICCSALLTTTMINMEHVVNLVKEKGLSDKIKVMIGGAPITQSFCDSIGADCYTADAATAAQAALEYCM